MSEDRLDDELAHARLSPSSAAGWMTCHDYPNANDGLPDDTSKAAAEGTLAHIISDECLTFGSNAYDYVGQRLKIADWTFEWTTDDADMLQPGIDRIRELCGEFFGEHRVDLSEWLGENQFGTLDRAVVSADLILIEDLKFGRGVPVSPVRNKQVMLYALGFWNNVARHLTDATDFLLSIDQPRCAGGGGEWRTTLDELLEFAQEAKEAAEATRAPNPQRVASEDGCRWCRRKDAPGGCPTYEAWRLELLGAQFEDLDGPMLTLEDGMTPERRARLLGHKAGIIKWLERHEEGALDDALSGRPCGGLKAVVDGRRGSRDKWKDEAAAGEKLHALLGAKSFTKKLITPIQACKQVSAEDRDSLEDLIQRGEKGHSLVPEEDARPAVTTVAADDFENLEGTE